MNWLLIKKISVCYLAIFLFAVAMGFLVSTLVEHGHKSTEFVGCYVYDAMLVGFKCQGFIGNSIVAQWLNWPLWLVYTPIMFFAFNLKAFLVIAMVWLPLILCVVSVVKLRRLRQA